MGRGFENRPRLCETPRLAHIGQLRMPSDAARLVPPACIYYRGSNCPGAKNLGSSGIGPAVDQLKNGRGGDRRHDGHNDHHGKHCGGNNLQIETNVEDN